MRQGDSIWTLDMVIQVALQQLSVGSMITGCRFLGGNRVWNSAFTHTLSLKNGWIGVWWNAGAYIGK